MRSRSPLRVFQKDEERVIPVVFHILHNLDESNISEERITQQMESLNADFNRLNTDTTDTPDIFKPVAANPDISFILAKRDPDGRPTSGITRHFIGSREFNVLSTSAALNTAIEVSDVVSWPTDQYLNIWVINMADNVLGFARFPQSNLVGLDQFFSFELQTDGVFVNFPFVGNNTVSSDFYIER